MIAASYLAMMEGPQHPI